jgi:serine/threonine protein kinase
VPAMDAAFPCPDLKFVAPLGRGGTAEVSRAFSHQFGRDVAVKYPLRDGESPECSFLQLARREHELIGDRRYPGLVRLLAAPHENHDYLLLELCTGPTLDTLGRVDNIGHAFNLISAAAVVLEYLNASELIHGDLKSSNFFLPPNWRMRVADKLFFLKLSDFSLGRRATEPDSSRLGVGTVGYMAPETIVESRTSTRSDLFALGVIAYQLLTATHPFIRDEADPVRVSSRVREGDYPNPRQLRPDLPDSLVQLLESLLAVDENARPVSGWDVCRQLESMGATYPYRKALTPHHMILNTASYDAVIESVLDLSSKDRARLDNITGGDVAALRLVLTASFRKKDAEVRQPEVCRHGRTVLAELPSPIPSGPFQRDDMAREERRGCAGGRVGSSGVMQQQNRITIAFAPLTRWTPPSIDDCTDGIDTGRQQER